MTTVAVNMRAPAILGCGDEATLAKKEAEREEAYAAMTCRYAVAPGHTLESPGGVLEAGDEVRPEEWSGVAKMTGFSTRLFVESLVNRGIVLDKAHSREGWTPKEEAEDER